MIEALRRLVLVIRWAGVVGTLVFALSAVAQLRDEQMSNLDWALLVLTVFLPAIAGFVLAWLLEGFAQREPRKK